MKKRLFRTNMLILFLALFSLMLVGVAVMVLFEDSIERSFVSMQQMKLDNNINQVSGLVTETNEKNWDEMKAQVENYGYKLAQIENGKVVKGFSGKEMEELAELLGQEKSEIFSGAEVFYHQKTTVAAKCLKDKNGKEGYILAAKFSKTKWWKSAVKSSFLTLIIAFLVAGVSAIAILLWLASFFTKKMTRVVMEPLEKLIDGAERIKEGNLTEEIVYSGEKEFENVCQTFNAMQYTILKEKEQRIKNEKARTEMVAGISHDLRTPLTSIQGYIKGVLDGVANTEEKRTRYLRTAYASTKDMNVLLQKLFDFSRMESGQMIFHKVPVEIAEYVQSYIAQKEELEEDFPVKFSFSKEKEVFSDILVDVEQVQRILDNLLENSRKYAKVTPVEIMVDVLEEEHYQIVSWKDNGQGVPEEKLDRIFEQFYRCDEARSEKGSGVGLYVVRYIMKQHGGRVEARNNHGLEVRLIFPERKKDD